MFRFETQSFFDFLKHVIRVSFLRAGGGGVGGMHNRKLDVHCSMSFGKITDAHIYCIYLFIYLTTFHTTLPRAKKSKKLSDFMKLIGDKPAETPD